MNEVFVGVGDTGPAVTDDLLVLNADGSTSSADLTGSSNLTFLLYADDGTLLSSGAGTLVSPTAPARVAYPWTTPAPATAGTYFRRWSVTLADGSHVHFPSNVDGWPVIATDPTVTAATGRLVCQPWCTAADVVRCQPCAGTTLDLDAIDEAIQTSSDILYLLSGRQFSGICTDVIRPVHDDVAGWWYPAIGSYSLTTGETWGVRPSYPYRDYVPDRRTFLSELRLPAYPIHSITQVLIDGQVVDPATYGIADDRWLVRYGGAWPVIQNLNLPISSPGTFQVTYTYGVAIPPMAAMAAAAYACQIVQACGAAGDGQCSLPPRAQQVVRQGISVRVLDPQDFTEAGRTGVPQADAFLKAVNPHGLQERAAVLSPDTDWPATRLR